MIRRALLIAVLLGSAGACGHIPPVPDGSTPLDKAADSPPPSKIQRLLVWLPPAPAGEVQLRRLIGREQVRLFDVVDFGNELKRLLEARGVRVLVATSSGFELNRADEQKNLIAQFKPTHRLELEISGSVVRSPVASTSEYQTGIVRLTLYNGEGTEIVRSRTIRIVPNRDDAYALAWDVVKRFEIEGFLEGRPAASPS